MPPISPMLSLLSLQPSRPDAAAPGWLPQGEWNAAQTSLEADASRGDHLAMAALARLAVARGRFADAARDLQKATAEPALSGIARAWVLLSSAWLGLEDARPLQALEDLKAVAEHLPNGDALWPRLDALMAEAFLRVGAQHEASAAASRALARAAQGGELTASCRARRVLAEVSATAGDGDKARQEFRAAVDDAERAQNPYELGQSLLSLGVFLGRRGAGDSARQALSLARTWFSAIGAEAKLREVDLYLERVHGTTTR